MKAVTGQDAELNWEKLRAKVDSLITERLNLFQDALIARGQIAGCANAEDPAENPSDQPLHSGS